MKLLHFLVFIVLIAYNSSEAQSRIGVAETRIRQDFKDKTFESGYTKDNDYYISFDYEYGGFVYYFDEEKVCTHCMLIPYNLKIVNKLVNDFNQKYVPVSDTKWKAYIEGGLIYINLNWFNGSELPVFGYTRNDIIGYEGFF